MPCRRIIFILAITVLIFASGPSKAKESEKQYEVLNPWGETDPGILRGISPRLDTLEGKKIGLFANYKHSAIPIALSLKEWLGSMYPESEFNIYNSDQQNVKEVDTGRGEAFKNWAKGNDAVILLVGS